MVASNETSGNEPEATLLDGREQGLAGSPEVQPLKMRSVPIVEDGEFAVRE